MSLLNSSNTVLPAELVSSTGGNISLFETANNGVINYGGKRRRTRAKKIRRKRRTSKKGVQKKMSKRLSKGVLSRLMGY